MLSLDLCFEEPKRHEGNDKMGVMSGGINGNEGWVLFHYLELLVAHYGLPAMFFFFF